MHLALPIAWHRTPQGADRPLVPPKRLGLVFMHRRLLNPLAILTVVVLGLGHFRWPFVIPLDRVLVATWLLGTLAIWGVAVVAVFAVVKGVTWLAGPVGILSVTGLLAAGVAGFFLGSVALFCIFFVLIAASSAVALGGSRSGSPCRRVFCRGFALCCWVGLGLTLLARSPVTGTPIVQIMWWSATAQDNAWGWNGASAQGVYHLVFTWLFGFAGAWLTRQYVALSARWNGEREEAVRPQQDKDLDTDPRPWEQPGQVRRDVEPHRGVLLLAVGWAGAVLVGFSFLLEGVAHFAKHDAFLWFSFFFALAGLPLGVSACGMAVHDLEAVLAGVLDPAGEAAARRTLLLGTLAVGGWAAAGLICQVLALGVY